MELISFLDYETIEVETSELNLGARETLVKLLSGGYTEDAATVLKDLDDRLNGGLAGLDPDVLKAYVAPSDYKVNRD